MVENKKYTQWITLFDDPEDDEFDGDLEADDEDLPRIHATFSITQVKRPERDQGSTGLDEISNEDSIISPPRDVEIVNNSQIEENMHVTTKTITM